MTRLTRRTPCIGICSTTYGDLVCRGCKRFAHEIVDWNRYNDAQREDVLRRLNSLKTAVIAECLQIVDRSQCLATMGEAYHEGDDLLLAAYEHLVALPTRATATAVSALSLRLSSELGSVQALRERVDGELLARSKAAYERNFKVLVD